LRKSRVTYLSTITSQQIIHISWLPEASVQHWGRTTGIRKPNYGPRWCDTTVHGRREPQQGPRKTFSQGP